MKPNLVMIHGWGYDKSCWPSALLNQLQQHFNVILLELPGHGEQPLDAPLDNDRNSDSVQRLDRWISARKQALPNQYHLLGWSLGGQVAIRMAHNNACLDRMVLLATNPKFSASDDWTHAMAAETLADFVQGYCANPGKTLRRFASLQTLGSSHSKALTMEILQLMQPQLSKAMGLALLQELDERQHLSQLTNACLIELAVADALVPSNWVEDFIHPKNIQFNHVAGSHSYLLESSKLGQRIIHFLMPETAVDRVLV